MIAPKSACFPCVVALASCLLVVGTARADDAVSRARELDEKARAAYQAGDLRGAAEAFRAANDLVPHPATKYNEARAWEAAGDLPRAAEAFEIALAAPGGDGPVLDGQRASDAKTRIDDLRGKLGRLKIAAPAGTRVSVAHLENAAVPVSPFVMPGEIVLRATFPTGVEQTRTTSVTAGETLVIELAEEKKEIVVRTERPVEPGVHPATIAGGVLLGLGAASGIVSAVFGVRTSDAVATFNDSGFTDAEARSDAVTSKNVTNALLGVALGMGAAGAVCLAVGLTSSAKPAEADVSVDVGLGSASLRVRF